MEVPARFTLKNKNYHGAAHSGLKQLSNNKKATRNPPSTLRCQLSLASALLAALVEAAAAAETHRHGPSSATRRCHKVTSIPILN